MEQKNSFPNNNELSQKDGSVSHSQKYRRFLITNSLVFFVSRVLSIVYIYVVTRLISDEVMALMIILATFQILFVNIIPIGFHYAVNQWTLTAQTSTSKYLKHYYSYTLFVSFPIISITALWVVIYTELPLFSINSVLFVVATLLTFFLEVLRNTEVALYNTDKAALLTGLYSIFNSIFVPVFYIFLFQDLFSVLLAWITALVVVICFDFRQCIPFLTFQIDLSEWKKMLIFSFPVWITTVINIITAQINRMYIYELFDDVSLNTFHWVDKNLALGLQFVTLFLAGVYSLLVKIRSENYQKFESVSRAMFKMMSLVGLFVFLTFYINAEFIVLFLLGDKYYGGITWMKFLSLTYIPQSIVNYLLIRFLANENRVEIIFIRGGGLVLRIVIALALLQLDVWGLFYAIFLTSIITLIAFIIRAQELRNWDRHIFLRFSSFVATGFVIVILFDLFLPWPLNNLALLILLIIAFIFKPLEKQDTDYIEQVIPKYGQKYVKLVLQRLYPHSSEKVDF